jgi:hypothetical protein
MKVRVQKKKSNPSDEEKEKQEVQRESEEPRIDWLDAMWRGDRPRSVLSTAIGGERDIT